MSDTKPAGRGQVRRQAILDAATELFLEKGFERTSLSDIVSRSKGSRSTLYEQFGNKEGLLRAMIEEVTAEVWMAIGSEDESSEISEEALVELARRFTRAALGPRAVSLFRIIANEGRRQPEIAEFFFDRGPRTAQRLLANRFRKALPPVGTTATPEQLGQVFLGAVLGVLHSHRLLGLPPASDDEIEAHVRVAVRVVLDGMRLPEGVRR